MGHGIERRGGRTTTSLATSYTATTDPTGIANIDGGRDSIARTDVSASDEAVETLNAGAANR